MATALDNGQRAPRKLVHAVIARLLGRNKLCNVLWGGRDKKTNHRATR
jgi:hypothetical protein